MKHIKYTKALLEEAVKRCYSVAQVMRDLGLAPSGNSHWYLSKRIKTYGIDTSHFKGQAIHRGNHDFNKKRWSDILVKSSKEKRVPIEQLRRALIESGREYKCEECGIKNIWNGKPLCVQVDHINGERFDNTPQNLRFLCPNCHTQTPTFGVKNADYNIKSLTKNCLACGEFFECKNPKRKYCSKKCSNRKENKTIKYKIDWPDKDVLLKMLSKSNYRQVGIKLGVSDNSIRKHLIS